MENTPNKTISSKKAASDAVLINYLKLKTDVLMLKTAVLSKKNKNMAIYLRQNLGVDICETCLGDGQQTRLDPAEKCDGQHTWLAPAEKCESCKGAGIIPFYQKPLNMEQKKLVFTPHAAGGYVFAGTLIGPAVRKKGQPAMLKVLLLGEERIVPAKGAKIVQAPDEL